MVHGLPERSYMSATDPHDPKVLMMLRTALSALALVVLLILTGCSGTPVGSASLGGSDAGEVVDTPLEGADDVAEDLAPDLPPAPSENPLCPVVAASGAVELIGSSEQVWDKQSTVGYARCQALDGRAGIVDVWVFPPDSTWGQDFGSTPGEYIRMTTESAPGSTLVTSGEEGDEAWAEYLAGDGSRPMVDVIAKDGALIAVAVTPIEGGGGTMTDVREITASIVATLDIPLTLAYAAAH